MLNYAGEYYEYGEYCDTGMHEAGAVPTRYVMNQHCLLCVRACENEYINNCQTVVMQRCKRVHFQAYSCRPSAKLH